MCPLYVSGLIGPGDRKSVQPMAARLAPGDYDQLHHFFISSVILHDTPLARIASDHLPLKAVIDLSVGSSDRSSKSDKLAAA
jgi:hypothetical protein